VRAVVFAYQEIGYVCLEELLGTGADVACLFTHDDDPGEEIWFRRPVELAREYGIPVYAPESLNSEKWITLIREMRPDVVFSFYYRKMIPKAILDIPRIGAFNLHGSLLPQYRGRCPVNWVLIAGEERTGVTLHFMVEKPDAGDIVAQKEVPIAFEDDVFSLYMKLVGAARELMQDVLPDLQAGTFTRWVQRDRRPISGAVSPRTASSTGAGTPVHIQSHQGGDPSLPGGLYYLDGKKLFVWKAYPENVSPRDVPAGTVISEDPLLVKTGSGSLRLISVEVEGDQEMDAVELASSRVLKNKILGGHP
jgi:methionyl-tRNA formyltransferase